jgi:hypothetical protein
MVDNMHCMLTGNCILVKALMQEQIQVEIKKRKEADQQGG